MGRTKLQLGVEREREASGRWIADIPDLPGVMAYGATKTDACRLAQALALEVLADRLEHGEHPLTGRPTRRCALGSIAFAYAPIG